MRDETIRNDRESAQDSTASQRVANRAGEEDRARDAHGVDCSRAPARPPRRIGFDAHRDDAAPDARRSRARKVARRHRARRRRRGGDDRRRRPAAAPPGSVDVLVAHDADDQRRPLRVPLPQVRGERLRAVGVVRGVEQHLRGRPSKREQLEPRRPVDAASSPRSIASLDTATPRRRAASSSRTATSALPTWCSPRSASAAARTGPPASRCVSVRARPDVATVTRDVGVRVDERGAALRGHALDDDRAPRRAARRRRPSCPA